MNFQMFKLELEKAKEPEIKLPTSVGSLKKQEISRKISTSALLTMPKPLTVCTTTNSGRDFVGRCINFLLLQKQKTKQKNHPKT